MVLVDTLSWAIAALFLCDLFFENDRGAMHFPQPGALSLLQAKSKSCWVIDHWCWIGSLATKN